MGRPLQPEHMSTVSRLPGSLHMFNDSQSFKVIRISAADMILGGYHQGLRML